MTVVEIDTANITVRKGAFNAIDLFCGAGGLSLGFEQAGFESLLGVEFEPHAAATYRRNFPRARVWAGAIQDLSDDALRDALDGFHLHVLLAGIPCQGFSLAGFRDPGDPRNKLFWEAVRCTKVLKPDFVVLENVPGILSMSDGEVVRTIVAEFGKLGYYMDVRVLQAADYGVPQLRKRVVFVGNRLGLPNPYPKPLLKEGGWVTARDALDDLKAVPYGGLPNHVWTKHNAKTVERISRVKPGESLYSKTFAENCVREFADRPAPIVMDNHGSRQIHYELDRVISPREMARLQGFPDDFVFEGAVKHVGLQVSNAVPVQLARHVALAIASVL